MAILICEECHNEFKVRQYRVVPGKRTTARFCSRKCKGAYRSKYYTGPDASAWKGGTTRDGAGYLQISSGPCRRKRVHRVIAEKALGKPLPDGCVVHHFRGDKLGNTNLVICQDQAYHGLLHRREKAYNLLKKGG